MKDFLIVCDSACNITGDEKEQLNLATVPLNLQLDDDFLIDDDNLDIYAFMTKMKNSTTIRSAAPSPQLFYEAMKGSDVIFAITITGKLSVTYSNACLAKEMSIEDNPNKKIHVFDSGSAAGGEHLMILKINECMSKGMSFEETVDVVSKFVDNLQTFFVLENLDNFIKNGRITKAKASIASMLSIKPIMYGVDGIIEVYKKVRGLKKAYTELINSIAECTDTYEDKILIITHGNCEERAIEIKKKIEEKYNFKEVIIRRGRGVTSIYEDDGGIIINY